MAEAPPPAATGGSRLIAALDTADPHRAAAWARAVTPHCGMLKLGLEFALANGPQGVRAILGRPLFLDLKLHDIPNTVAGAVRALLPLRPAMLTVHAAGGAAMIAAAAAAAQSADEPRPVLLAVTVLTSLDPEALHATGVAGGPRQQVLRLARMALDAGADGLVCSAHELPALRDAFGTTPVLVVPGIRPDGAPAGDQARTTTPAQAMAAGADWLVVGRPITGSPDPAEAARLISLTMQAPPRAPAPEPARTRP